MSEILHGFVHLLYPELCIGCHRQLAIVSNCFCLRCKMKLEPTDHLQSISNEFTDRFWGLVPIQFGASMYYFNKNNPIQHAMHALKYGNRPDVGLRLGRQLGIQLSKTEPIPKPDYVIPVPLHPIKERKRGYNQSACFSRGIAESMQITHLPKAMKRTTRTQTQTNKSRMDRFGNVEGVFAVATPEKLQGKMVLLADDVLTTGATLESCCQALAKADVAGISLVTIAIAMNRSY